MIGEDEIIITPDERVLGTSPSEPDSSDDVEVGGFDCEELAFRWNNIIPVAETWDKNLQRTVDALLHEPFTTDTSRRVVDMVASRMALERLTPEQRQYINQYLEAFVPLAGSGIDELEDCYYVILGNNAPERQVSEGKLHEDFERVKALFDEEAQKPPRDDQEDRDGDRPVAIIEIAPDNPLWQQYLDCLGHLEYVEEDTEEEICFAAVTNGTVVSSGLMIDDAIEVKRHGKQIPIRLVEMTGAFTLPEFQRRGIYKKLLREEYRRLAAQEDSVHIVEGFTRDSEPALRVVAGSERMVFHPDTDVFGLTPHGLVNHGPGDNADVFVTHYFNFLPGDRLREKFGK